MSKSRLKLSRKTEMWLHRSKSEDSVTLPAIDARLLRIRLLGNSHLLDTGELLGTGDYDEESGKYTILFRAHGKNLYGANDYIQTWIDSGAYTNYELKSTTLKLTFSTAYNGTTIFDKRHIKFKENTQYTISGRFQNPKQLYMRFVYSDGTYSDTTLQNVKSLVFYSEGVAISLKDKTLVGIESYTDAEGRYYTTTIKQIGIYEGAQQSHADCYEEYNGESFRYYLDAPLMRIGYASDELDLMSGEVTRKIRTETVGSKASIEGAYAEGIYVIAPEVPLRADSPLYSSLPVLTEADIMTAETGVSLCEGGKICVKIPDINSEEELLSYLKDNPFTITYIMSEPIKEMAEGSLPNRDMLSVIDAFCEVLPRKFYAEYV